MPVRSGGILDEDGAMGIARILNTEGWLVTKPELLLKRFRCDPLWYWQRGECERNADAQIRWLNGSDAFSNN
jgi:hypothetical protein